jgi:hypothetical protein
MAAGGAGPSSFDEDQRRATETRGRRVDWVRPLGLTRVYRF